MAGWLLQAAMNQSPPEMTTDSGVRKESRPRVPVRFNFAYRDRPKGTVPTYPRRFQAPHGASDPPGVVGSPSNQSPFPRKSDFWPQRQTRQKGSEREVLSLRDSRPAERRKTKGCWRPGRKCGRWLSLGLIGIDVPSDLAQLRHEDNAGNQR